MADPIARISTHKATRRGQFREIARRLNVPAKYRGYVNDLPGTIANALESAYRAGQANGPDTDFDHSTNSLISWMEIPAKSRDALQTMCLFLENSRTKRGADVYPGLIGYGQSTGPRAGPHYRYKLYYARHTEDENGTTAEAIEGQNHDYEWGWHTIKPLIDLEVFEFSESGHVLIATELFDDVLSEWEKYGINLKPRSDEQGSTR